MCDRKMVAETGDLRFDKLGRPRALMVDLTTTARPIALQTYPARVLYRCTGFGCLPSGRPTWAMA